MRKPLSIDGDMARRFLDLLDPDHDQFLFAAGDDNQASLKAGKPPWADHRHGSIDAQLKMAQRAASPGLGHLHHRPAHEGQAPAGQERGGHSAVWHEWDTAAPPPAFELPPSLVVESSVGVDTNGEIFPRLHHYWFVDPEHPISAEDFHGLMECMVETHGSDPDAKDLARVLRLPGSWHQKGDPHQVKIVGGCHARYGRDELIKAFPPAQA
jgi:hypothetical protein